MIRASKNFASVKRRTITTDRHTHDGPSCTTVMIVRDPNDKGLQKFSTCPTTDTYDGPSHPRRSVLHDRHDGQRPPLIRVSQHFLSVLRQTLTKNRRTDDGSSCTIVMIVRDPNDKGLQKFFKCPTTDTYDGPSHPRRSDLHDRHDGQRPL